MRSSSVASSSVFHCSRLTCQVPSANAVAGIATVYISNMEHSISYWDQQGQEVGGGGT